MPNSMTTRRRFLPLVPMGALLLMLGAAGCTDNKPAAESGTSAPPASPAAGAETAGASPAAEAGGAKTGANLTICVIPKGLTHVYWQAVHAGADKASAETGATIKWDGPQKESDVSAQIGVVENAINSKVDGIVLAPIDKSALKNVVEKAKSANIPVTIFDSAVDVPEADYLSYAATDNKKGGAMAADRMGELLGGKGTVAMIPVLPNSASTGDRESGFETELKAKYPNIKLIKTNYGMSDRAMSLKVAEDVLTANPGLNGIFGPNEPAIVGALQAAKNKNLIGKIKLVGFDNTKQLEDSLAKGEIDSLVLQNPAKMGYEGVKTIVDFKNGKTPPKKIDTGVALETKDNMNSPEMADLRSK